jgi:2-aminoadipate transaminase
MESSTIQDILKLTQQPDMISFAGGLPSPDVFPMDLLAAAINKVLEQDGSSAFQYSLTEGYEPLRAWLVEWLLARRGISSSLGTITITSGSQQALDLVGKVLIDPGDVIVVGAPSYLGALQAFGAYKPRFVTVELDEDGMQVEQLPAIIKREHPKCIYEVTNFQNPSGVCLSKERREYLAQLGEQHGIVIVEDDPYGELRYEGKTIPAVRTFGAQVVYLTSFSKILAPGLRVGVAIGPEEIIAKMRMAKQGVDLHTGSLDQQIAYHICMTGEIEAQIDKIIRIYGERRHVMLDAMEQYFPADRVKWTRPQGGMFVWVTLPPTANASDILKEAIEEKVAFVPGYPCYADGRGANTLRLNFSSSDSPKIQEGIQKLGKLFANTL